MMRAWVTILVRGLAPHGVVDAISRARGVTHAIRRDDPTATVLMLRCSEPLPEMVRRLIPITDAGITAQTGAGAEHETDPAARAHELGLNTRDMLRAVGAVVSDTEQSRSTARAIKRVEEDSLLVTRWVSILTIAVRAAYQGALEACLLITRSASQAQQLMVERLALLDAGTDEEKREAARLIATWAMSLRALQSIEEAWPLKLGPVARECMLVSVVAVEQLLSRIME